MSKKEIDVVTKKTLYICDICGRKFIDYRSVIQCTYCKKDFCSDCGGTDGSGDYPSNYCKEHFNKYKVYYKEKRRRELSLEKELDNLYDEIMSNKHDI